MGEFWAEDHEERPSHADFLRDLNETLRDRCAKLPGTTETSSTDSQSRRLFATKSEVLGNCVTLTYDGGGDTENTGELQRQAKRTIQERRKLVIILVGLPGRGKTYLCNKLMCYLNWLGHGSKHFNVGSYRRRLGAKYSIGQDSTVLFDHENMLAVKLRNDALDLALSELMRWMQEDESHQVAIFDATNSTQSRRDYLIKKFHGVYKYLFIESICNDPDTLMKNVKLKIKYSPDYVGMDPAAALQDFEARVEEYKKVYEPLTDGKSNRHIHFIQLNDMVTGRGYMDVNRISGYLPGKLVFFLMQVCRSGLNANRRIWLTRHGESDFNRMGKIGGDSSLSPLGRKYASALARALVLLVPVPTDSSTLAVSCWTSTLQRTIQTARDIPFPKLRWKALDEIQAGICDGHTYEEIKEKWPETYAARKADKLNFRYPAGESYMDVVKRLESVIIEAERETESVCIVAHQAILRVLYGYFMQAERSKMPELEMPLHTLIELEPRPDGTYVERRFGININYTSDIDIFESMEVMAAPASPGSRVNYGFDHLDVDVGHVVAGRRAARETAELQAGAANHKHSGSGATPLKQVAFNMDGCKEESQESLTERTLTTSARQGSIVSVASCASKFPPGMDDTRSNGSHSRGHSSQRDMGDGLNDISERYAHLTLHASALQGCDDSLEEEADADGPFADCLGR